MIRKTIVGVLVLSLCCAVAVFSQGKKKPDAKPAAANGATITVSNFQFEPKTVTIKAGSEVTWMNKGGAHTVTADDGSWASPTLGAEKSFSRKFTRPGTYRYFCSFHGSKGGGDMAGVIKVVR
jgi:plastocyanin